MQLPMEKRDQGEESERVVATLVAVFPDSGTKENWNRHGRAALSACLVEPSNNTNRLISRPGCYQLAVVICFNVSISHRSAVQSRAQGPPRTRESRQEWLPLMAADGALNWGTVLKTENSIIWGHNCSKGKALTLSHTHTHLVHLSAAKQNYSISTGKLFADGRICNELLTSRDTGRQLGHSNALKRVKYLTKTPTPDL